MQSGNTSFRSKMDSPTRHHLLAAYLLHTTRTEKIQNVIPDSHAAHVKKRGTWVNPVDKRINEFKRCVDGLIHKFEPDFIAGAFAPFFVKKFDLSNTEMRAIFE